MSGSHARPVSRTEQRGSRAPPDFLVPASRSPSPDHQHRVLSLRPLFEEVVGGVRGPAGPVQLLSTHCKGAFDRSPWERVTPVLPSAGRPRGIPRDMDEWEEWEQEKLERQTGRVPRQQEVFERPPSGTAAVTVVASTSQRRRSSQNSAVVEVVSIQRQTSLLGSFPSSKPSASSSSKLRSVPPTQSLLHRGSVQSQEVPTVAKAAPVVSSQSQGLTQDWTDARGDRGDRTALGRDEEVIFEAGCTQMVLNNVTQPTPASPAFPPLSFPAGLPTSTPRTVARPQPSVLTATSQLKPTSELPTAAQNHRPVDRPRSSEEGPFASLMIRPSRLSLPDGYKRLTPPDGDVSGPADSTVSELLFAEVDEITRYVEEGLAGV